MGSIKLCPRCGGTLEAISERTGGFSGTKAVVGAVIAGPVGVAAGALGKKLVTLQCANCGFTLETKEKDANEIAEYNKAMAAYEVQVKEKETIETAKSPYMDEFTIGREKRPITLSVPNYLPPLLSDEGWANQRKQSRALAAGENHIVALKADGTVVAAGNNEHGQCDVQDWTDVVEVHASKEATFGLRKDGTVLFAGKRNGLEAVEGWKNVRLLCPSGYGSSLYWTVVGVTADRQLLFAGAEGTKNKDGVKMISVWTDKMGEESRSRLAGAQELAVCGHTILALGENGKVGSIGVDNDGSVNDPTAWTGMVSVAAGRGCSFGLRKDGTILRAGIDHPSGQLAESLILLEKTMFLSQEYPVLIKLSMLDNDVIAITHSTFLRADGTVVPRFGGNMKEMSVESLDPEVWHDIVAVVKTWGSSNYFGIRADGRAVLRDKTKEQIYAAAKDWDNLYVVPGQREYVLQRLVEREEEVRQFWAGEDEKKTRSDRRRQGLCQYCGGKFSLFGRTCKECGKPKDY